MWLKVVIDFYKYDAWEGMVAPLPLLNVMGGGRVAGSPPPQPSIVSNPNTLIEEHRQVVIKLYTFFLFP